jgi:hypothetical protein
LIIAGIVEVISFGSVIVERLHPMPERKVKVEIFSAGFAFDPIVIVARQEPGNKAKSYGDEFIVETDFGSGTRVGPKIDLAGTGVHHEPVQFRALRKPQVQVT